MARQTPKRRGKLLVVWVPEELIPLLDAGVIKERGNRSEFIRDAIREKLRRKKISKPTASARNERAKNSRR